MRGNGKGLLIRAVCSAFILLIEPAVGANWSTAPAAGRMEAAPSSDTRPDTPDLGAAPLDTGGARLQGAFLPAPGVLALIGIAVAIAGPWHRRRSPETAETLSGPAD